MKTTIIGTAVIILACVHALSQTCCSGGVPLANNVGGLPVVDSGSIQLTTLFDLNILNTLKEGNRTLDDRSRTRKTWSALLHGGYAFSSRWSLEGLFSWVRQERLISQTGGFEDFTHTQGIGDAVMLAKYGWLKRNKIHCIIGAGVKLPLGATNLKDDNDIALNADLQPGSGALDYIISHQVEWTQTGNTLINVAGNLVYRITGTNKKYFQSQHYRFGNELQIMLGVSRQFLLITQLLDLQFGIRYRSAGDDLIDGHTLPNTGGRWLFAVPGINWNINPWFSLSASTDLPLYSRVTGTQLSPSMRFIIGGYYLLKKNEESWKSF